MGPCLGEEPEVGVADFIDLQIAVILDPCHVSKEERACLFLKMTRLIRVRH